MESASVLKRQRPDALIRATSGGVFAAEGVRGVADDGAVDVRVHGFAGVYRPAVAAWVDGLGR